MFIKQISIYLENVRGSLRELTQLLGENSINLLALSVADTSGFGIIRCIVKSDEIEKAMDALKKAGYIAKTNSVICVSIPHRPLGLASVLRMLDEGGISVEYSYSFCRSTLDDAVIIIRPSDKDRCAEILQEHGVRLISQAEVDGF
jgi:hypothetical protein